MISRKQRETIHELSIAGVSIGLIAIHVRVSPSTVYYYRHPETHEKKRVKNRRRHRIKKGLDPDFPGFYERATDRAAKERHNMNRLKKSAERCKDPLLRSIFVRAADLGMSTQALADRAGYSRQYIINVRGNRDGCPYFMARDLANAVGLEFTLKEKETRK